MPGPRIGEVEMKCKKCSSNNVIKAGFNKASGELRQRYYCNSCYHYFNE